jgi:hypothetical protein
LDSGIIGKARLPGISYEVSNRLPRLFVDPYIPWHKARVDTITELINGTGFQICEAGQGTGVNQIIIAQGTLLLDGSLVSTKSKQRSQQSVKQAFYMRARRIIKEHKDMIGL